MERRQFIKQAGATVALAGSAGTLVQSCTAPQSGETEAGKIDNVNQELIAHYVLFWLNDGLSEEEIADFAGFFEDLKAIPGIKSLHYGRAAQTNPRDVVDNSFTYNLLVYFDSMKEINVYETHPIHLRAIEKYSKYWNNVVVHDSILKQAVV